MFSILIVYYIGKQFYKLAEKFNQKKWLYAILGVLAYYLGAIALGGIVIGLIIEFFMNSDFESYSNTVLGLFMMPIGIVACVLFHYLLERKWKKSVIYIKDEIQDIGKHIEGKD